VTKPLHELTATEAAAAIRAGSLRSIELVDACLARIATRENEVHAWTHIDAAAAQQQARALDAQAPTGPLHGVPIGVKDIIDTQGMPTLRGSSVYQGSRMPWDAACVSMARRAGAIVLGKTVTTEFAYFQPGPTRNPRNLGHTPGGSSSGSAAAVADGMVPLAFGSQTAGSLTRPASYCGVVGYKPTFGTFTLAGIKPFAPSLDTLGVIARSIEDTALMRAVMLGLPAHTLESGPIHQLRVGFCRTPWWTESHSYARAGMEDVFARLAQTRATVGQVDLPASCDRLVEAQKIVMAYEAAFSLSYEYDRHSKALSAALRGLVEAGSCVARDEYLLNLSITEQARRDVAGLFDDWDVLLVPAAHGEAPEGISATGDPLFSRAWTLLGLPTLTMPAFLGPNGLPVGLQLIGPCKEDIRLLQAALSIQSTLHLGDMTAPATFREKRYV